MSAKRRKDQHDVETAVPELTNEQRIISLTVDETEGETTIVLVNEDRLSGSEKNIVKCGVIGQMRLKIGDKDYVLACSLYTKNPDYNAAEAAKRLAAKNGGNKTRPAFQATVVTE